MWKSRFADASVENPFCTIIHFLRFNFHFPLGGWTKSPFSITSQPAKLPLLSPVMQKTIHLTEKKLHVKKCFLISKKYIRLALHLNFCLCSFIFRIFTLNVQGRFQSNIENMWMKSCILKILSIKYPISNLGSLNTNHPVSLLTQSR